MALSLRMTGFLRVGRQLVKSVKMSRAYSSGSTFDISGIYPPIPTPFNTDESVAYDKLEFNMKKWNETPIAGYIVQGSNGEYTFLTPEERVDIVRRVKDLAAPGKRLIAGSGCESTRDTIAMTKKMAEAGAEAVMVVTPCYYKGRMTNDALTQHYTKVADASPVPVILYSVPGNTGIDLSADVVIKLAKHPNIIGMKDSGGDVAKLGHMVYKTSGDGFQIMAGSAGFLYGGYAVGCVGGVCAIANVLGHEVCKLDSLIREGKAEEAKELQQRMIAVNAAVTKVFGIAGMKKAMEWYGLYGGPTRSPLQPLSDAEVKVMRDTFTSAGFL